jgi:hypothetical protein
MRFDYTMRPLQLKLDTLLQCQSILVDGKELYEATDDESFSIYPPGSRMSHKAPAFSLWGRRVKQALRSIASGSVMTLRRKAQGVLGSADQNERPKAYPATASPPNNWFDPSTQKCTRRLARKPSNLLAIRNLCCCQHSACLTLLEA